MFSLHSCLYSSSYSIGTNEMSCCSSVVFACLLYSSYSLFISLFPSIIYIIFQFILQSVHLLYKYTIRINFCFIRTRRINFSNYTNKLLSLRINFPGTLYLCTAEGADKYETGTNVTRITKKTPLTTFCFRKVWRYIKYVIRRRRMTDQ